jgi:hypothetical protein
MGKTILYIGLAILILGISPLLIVGLLPEIGIGDPKPNPVGLGILAMLSFWPGIGMTSAGALICVFNCVMDRLHR